MSIESSPMGSEDGEVTFVCEVAASPHGAPDILDALDALEDAGEPGGLLLQVGEPPIAEDDLERLEALGGAQHEVLPMVAQRFDEDLDLDRLAALGHRRQVGERRRFEQRSADLMAHARQALERQRHQQAMASAQVVISDQSAQLASVQQSFPEVARVVGIKRARVAPSSSSATESGRKAMSAPRAAHLIRSSYLEKVPRGLGVKHDRLVAFASDLVLHAQAQGLAKLVLRCAQFRACAAADCVNVCMLGYSHESDSTHQSLAQHMLQLAGRPTKQRLRTEIVNQRGTLHLLVMVLRRSSGEVLDEASATFDWHSSSIVIVEKGSRFIARALQLGMPFCLGEAGWEGWRDALDIAFDAVIVDQHGDRGSNNFPAFRHNASILGEAAAVMNDVSTCEIHSLQNMKNSIAQVRFDVGKMFSLSNALKVASYHTSLLNTLYWQAHNTVLRIVARPPAVEQDDLRLLVQALFEVDAPRHQRAGGKPSYLLGDLQLLCQVPLHGLQGLAHDDEATAGISAEVTRIHYCFDESTAGPCCVDDNECFEKIAVAHINTFCSATFDLVSLSRFTSVAKSRKKLILGLMNERMFISAASFCARRVVGGGENPSVPTVSAADNRPEEIGSGVDDAHITHRTRLGRLAQWFNSRGFLYSLPIAEATESIIDKMQYDLFGFDGKSIDPLEFCSEHSPIGAALDALWGLASSWECDRNGPWQVLVLSGWRDFSSQDVRMLARSHCLGLSAELDQRFDRKFSNLPWALAKLVRSDVSQADKTAVCQGIIAALDCQLPVFVKAFRQRFPALPEMLSPHAEGVIKVWLAGKRLSTKSSELGHASERRALAAASAPGRSFIPHARRDLMRKHRLSHIARHGADPIAEVRIRGGAPCKPVVRIAPGILEERLPREVLEDSQAIEDEGPQDILKDVAHVPLRAVVPSPAPAAVAALAGSAAGDLVPLSVQAPGQQSLPAPPAPPVQTSTSGGQTRSGRGGSIYLVHLNECRRQAKLACGGRKLTKEEMVATYQRAKEEFNCMSTEELDALAIMHRRAVRLRKEGPPASSSTSIAEAHIFQPALDGAGPDLPIEPSRFCSVHPGC